MDGDSVSVQYDSGGQRFSPLRLLLFVIGFTAVVAMVGMSYYFYTQYRKTQVLLANPEAAARVEVMDTVSRIKKLVEVPEGEMPTVATVSDIEKLANQPFFAKAQKGDKVIVYQSVQKAILYRPSTNRIVEMAPLNLQSSASVAGATDQTTPSPTSTPVTTEEAVAKAKLVIYNGTTTTGLAARAETKLLAATGDKYEVVNTGNAMKRDYAETVIVVINDQMQPAADMLSQNTGAEIVDMPEGEVPPEADLLLIIGQDYQE